MRFRGDVRTPRLDVRDGHLLSIAQNQALLIVGTTYGGDGVCTFALPDLQQLPVAAEPVRGSRRVLSAGGSSSMH